ncbi:MAG: hypothetical protein U9N39_09050 [Campylobacterota bacterium]|nr:hypothetical protein [Campylobacterota bacterium]
MKLLVFIILFCISLFANDKYSVRAMAGKVTMSDFSEIMVLNWQGHPYDLKVYSVDGGYQLAKDYKQLPLDFYLKSSLSYYDEDGYKDNIYELTLYFKAYWSFFGKKMRFGLGEGVSYTSGVLTTEYLEASEEGDFNSKFLNYLDVSLDVDLGKMFNYKALDELYIGWGLKHRSGIFGLINNVKRGGSNYNCIYIEKNF